MLDKNYGTATSTHKSLSQFEEEENLKSSIEASIYLIFVLSQSYPVEGVASFFDGSNFAMTEAYYEFKSSYQITKFGFFKQGLMSLRSGLELGVLSTYWSVVGKDDRTFKNWIRAREKTPFSNGIQRKLLTNQNINIFNTRYPIKEFFDSLGILHNYIHTKGVRYSTFGEFQKLISKQESSETLFGRWYQAFQECIQLIVILHLLKFPIASLEYDFIKKFGSYSRSPFCGGLFGSFQGNLVGLLGQEKLSFIQEIARSDNETVELLNWLDSHPDLSQEEIDLIVTEEQREWEEAQRGWEEQEEFIKEFIRQMNPKTE